MTSPTPSSSTITPMPRPSRWRAPRCEADGWTAIAAPAGESLDQPPALHRQAPRRTRGERRVVRDDEYGGAASVDAIEQGRDVLAGLVVQLARRLVGDQQ